ncbi:MAG: Flp pilus assembly protein CpaB [Alphaproteobacteria bacterium]|jgi:Flp pilus assembly protein CpaB|nr:RcpC/CpaB family pilus assembly protein [Alphaproteobacteria bacterium]
MKLRDTLILFLAFALAVVVFFFLFHLWQKHQDSTPKTVTLMTATHDLTIGHLLTSRDFAATPWTGAVPEKAFIQGGDHESFPEGIVGASVPKGAPLTKDALITGKPEAQELAPQDGKYIYRLVLPKEQTTFVGIFKPGDRIDVIVSQKEEKKTDSISSIYLSRIKVLGFNGKSTISSNGEEPRTLSLELNQRQAQSLSQLLSQKNPTLHLDIRSMSPGGAPAP